MNKLLFQAVLATPIIQGKLNRLSRFRRYLQHSIQKYTEVLVADILFNGLVNIGLQNRTICRHQVLNIRNTIKKQ